MLSLGIPHVRPCRLLRGFANEEAFGQALALEKGLREQMTIVIKCGIVFPNAQLPEMKSKHYDNSRAHIVWSAERSVEKLQCGYLDLLLIHRPPPCAHPEEIAAAFDDLHRRGLVRRFWGVKLQRTEIQHAAIVCRPAAGHQSNRNFAAAFGAF